MEECPICFEPMKETYTLYCNHSICLTCAKQCKKLSTESCLNVTTNFPIYIKNGNPIKGPLCRTLEPKYSVDEFKKYAPDKYNEWMQLELHCDEYGCSFHYYYESYIEIWRPNYKRVPNRITWNHNSKKQRQRQRQGQK
jgi:hypothetical protein